MPEPTTAAIVAKYLAAAAKKKIAEKVIELAITSLFGKQSEFDDIKEQLASIEGKIDDLMVIASESYVILREIRALVENLPQNISTFQAHRQLEAIEQALLALGRVPTEVGYDTFVSGVNAFNTICDYEHKYDQMLKVPRYAEVLYVLTKGHFAQGIIAAIRRLRRRLEDRLAFVEKEQIEATLLAAERIIGSQHIRSGSISRDAPYIIWVPQPDRTREVVDVICHGPSHVNGQICVQTRTQVPDTQWNAAVDSKEQQLRQLQAKIPGFLSEADTLGVVLAVLERYSDLIEAAPLPAVPDASSFVKQEGGLI